MQNPEKNPPLSPLSAHDRAALLELLPPPRRTGAEIVPIAASGSSRRYYRLTFAEGRPLIGTIGTDVAENRAFVALSRHFAAKGLPVPEVVAVSADGAAYLQTDAGEGSLFEAIARGRSTGLFSPEETALLERAMEMLAEVQVRGAEGLDFSVCFPTDAMDARMVRWDLAYFKYCFLKPSGLELREEALQDDFDRLEGLLLPPSGVTADTTFMVRDFQSRNVMVDPQGGLTLIDFQGGRRGPAEYDVASFLWQAKAHIPRPLRQHLVEVYTARRGQLDAGFDAAEFRRRLPRLVLLRTLQVLGAYGFRGLIQGKPHFSESIAAGVGNLVEILGERAGEFPELEKVAAQLAEKWGGEDKENREKKEGKEKAERDKEGVAGKQSLVVTVGSFSYKKGLPSDPSGNGGGFVFDCRATHNPGRYEQFKQLSGRDAAVIHFLEEDGEITPFLEHAQALVDASVERYLQRGFTSLSVWFGCTGGQHRSVYSAEHTARHLNAKYGVEVRLVHREQGIVETFPQREATFPTFDSSLRAPQLRPRALVFAAGIGSRLKPFTDLHPKALVQVGGVPMLERVLLRLKEAGVGEAVVNVCHKAEQITDFLEKNGNFGLDIHISDETERLLDTGGGLLKARQWLDRPDGAPILLHNADILTDAPLGQMLADHAASAAAATLLCSHRGSSRRLWFMNRRLVGWQNVKTGETRPGRFFPNGSMEGLAFGGVHVVSPSIFEPLERYAQGQPQGVFSLTPFYVDNARRLDVRCYTPASPFLWHDVGSPEKLKAAEEAVSSGAK